MPKEALWSGRSSHRCPSWCHKCPDLFAITADRGGDVRDPLEFTMPGCMGGSHFGIGGCHCEAYEFRKDRRSVSTRPERIALLRELITAYPAHARRLVAELAPPKETPTPRLRCLSGAADSERR